MIILGTLEIADGLIRTHNNYD